MEPRLKPMFVLQRSANFGEIWGYCPLFIVQALSGNLMYNVLQLALKPRHVRKFREGRLTDVGESALDRTPVGPHNHTCVGCVVQR